jgi:hypothetical protein
MNLFAWLLARAGGRKKTKPTRLGLTETDGMPHSMDMNAINPPPPSTPVLSTLVPSMPAYRPFVIDDPRWNPGSTSLQANDATVRPGRRTN